MSLDKRIAELSAKYLPLARQILEEAIRIPADYAESDKANEDGYHTGMSNHEGPRLEYLKKMIISEKCVDSPEDVTFDKIGNIVWSIQDKEDGIPADQKRVVYFDGHTDTVCAIREQWKAELGEGIDAFHGITDKSKVSEEALHRVLPGVPCPKEHWDSYIFGRGSCDQLAGVISQIVSSKIMLELKPEGALKGVIVRSVGTVCEEDNDGCGPMYIIRETLPEAEKNMVPDVIIMTEGTGDSDHSSLGIYRGQRGRMQIEVEVTGISCHGSMPRLGKNPLEFGSRILVEATEQVERGEGILDNEFLSKGTRTASWCKLDTPSDCAVPERFTFRFDRRMTIGETPAQCIIDIENLPAVAVAREAGLTVVVRVPKYEKACWRGYYPMNDQTYLGWETPEDHPAIQSAVTVYKNAITPFITEQHKAETCNMIKEEPRVSRWWFSTDGVGCSIPTEQTNINHEGKNWIVGKDFKHPAMLGVGAGYEMCAHKIGEFVSTAEMQHAISFMARFPSQFVETAGLNL